MELARFGKRVAHSQLVDEDDQASHASAALTTGNESVRHHTGWTAVAADVREMSKWDFVIQRSDGTRCWLHPSYSSQTFLYGEEDPSLPAVQPPNAGRGAWDYRGHYKFFKIRKHRRA